jgi:hypothetical protein
VATDIAARATASTNRVTVTVLSTVTNTVPGGLAVTRTWRATDACGNYSDCSQTVMLTGLADLSVGIVSSANPALVGSNLICTITVSNNGASRWTKSWECCPKMCRTKFYGC